MQIFSRQTLVLALMLSIGCVASGPSSAVEIYKYVDSNGRVHLTDRPPHNGYQLIQKAGKKLRMPRINLRDKDANRKRFASKIAEVASRYQVPEALIHAVITVESAYDPNAISRAGAVGLMQLMPATARRYGVANRRNPYANLTGGTRYLKDLLLRFDRNLELALAGYNAGENAVEKFGNQIPPFDETQNYVRKVLQLYSQQSAGLSGDV
ncbi:MAG: lytic transglycosylase domain-containing protein [Gammaproteobacteria bacterium]|nr:lytic transglycosylase domain-containing protein [Gammaproteobacteria bacterium]MDH3859263.1 lytic transglycosylase domain-containing protein [Gammaproteobacteria bacterium]